MDRAGLLARSDALAVVVALVVLGVVVCLRQQSDWDDHYVPAAARLAAGGDVFQGGFVYPPVNAWLALPFVGLPRLPGRLLWFAVNAAALVVLVGGAWRLAGGRRGEHAVFWLGLACAAPFALDALSNLQTDLCIGALVVFGGLALAAGKDRRAGLLFGVAAGVKCTPLLLAVYLAWRRRWAAAALVPLVAVGVNLLPDLTHPPPGPRLVEWGRRFLAPMAGKDHDLGVWAAAISFNHSLSGLTGRWLAWERTWQDGKLVPVAATTAAGPLQQKLVKVGVMLLFVAAAAACSWKGGRPEHLPLELGLALILMPLLSPHSSKPHYCTLMLPAWCLARAALDRRSGVLLAFVVAAAMCAVVSNKDLVGARLYGWLLWHGSVTLAAVLLFAGCCVALLQRRPAAEALCEAVGTARAA